MRDHIDISESLMLLDTNKNAIDMLCIDNRRFMFSSKTGELILGKQYHGREIIKSHAEEYANSGAKAAFDSFVRGWIGTGRSYKNGIIHFAPPIDEKNCTQFDNAYSALEMFQENGANGKTVVRGFGSKWEQPLKEILQEGATHESHH